MEVQQQSQTMKEEFNKFFEKADTYKIKYEDSLREIQFLKDKIKQIDENKGLVFF